MSDHFKTLCNKRLNGIANDHEITQNMYRVIQKQPPRGVPRKRFSETIQQIYRGTPMPKCDFNKVAKQLC